MQRAGVALIVRAVVLARSTSGQRGPGLSQRRRAEGASARHGLAAAVRAELGVEVVLLAAPMAAGALPVRLRAGAG
jgi:IS5 family transposase